MDAARPLRSTRRLQNLAGTRPKWYRIQNQAQGQPTTIAIFDEIGFYAVTADDFVRDLAAIDGDVELHINSPGGDIFEGLTIYNNLRQRKGTVGVTIDGLAASAASFIAMAATKGQLKMAPHSQMMIHDGFSMAIGNADDMRKMADLLEMQSDNIANIYAERSGKPAAYWRGLMKNETWLTDQQAVAEGLADKILGQESPQDSWDLSVFAKFANAAPMHEPMTGTHSHKGPSGQDEREHSHDGDASHEGVYDPDGDGDDDSTAEGDTDHDYVMPDGSPGPKASVRNEVDNSPWDASKAWHNGATSDDPAAFYKGICAGRKEGDPSNQSSWALPYKYHPSDPPNAAGVRNALSRLPQTEGLTNEDEARATLERAMKQVNPDYEPDDLFDPGLLSAALLTALEGVNVR